MKRCKTCGEVKPFSEFHATRRKGKEGFVLKSDCKICHRRKKRDRDQQVNQEYDKWFKTIPKICEKCGEIRPYLIDFHHMNPALKTMEISQIRSKSWSVKRKIEVALTEIDKCIQLCSNCHREFHHLERHHQISLDEYL